MCGACWRVSRVTVEQHLGAVAFQELVFRSCSYLFSFALPLQHTIIPTLSILSKPIMSIPVMSSSQIHHERYLQHVIYALLVTSLAVVTSTTLLRMYSRIKIIKQHTWEDCKYDLKRSKAFFYLLTKRKGSCVSQTYVISIAYRWVNELTFLAWLYWLLYRRFPWYEIWFRLWKAAHNRKPDSYREGIGIFDGHWSLYWWEVYQVIYAVESLYPPIIATAKISILLQLMRLFTPIPGSTTRYGMIVFIWVNVAWFTAAFFATVFQCTPVAKFWNSYIPGHCINYAVYIVVVGVFNMVVDIVMLTVPLIWIWRLNMSPRRKIGVSAIFIIGTLWVISKGSFLT